MTKTSNTPKLTANQKQILVAFIHACQDCNGATTIDEILQDNMTWASVKDLADETGLAVKTVRSTLSSLTKKGWVSKGEKNSETREIQLTLTEAGIRAAFPLTEKSGGPTPATAKSDASWSHETVDVKMRKTTWTLGKYTVRWEKRTDPWFVFDGSKKIAEFSKLSDAKAHVESLV